VSRLTKTEEKRERRSTAEHRLWRRRYDSGSKFFTLHSSLSEWYDLQGRKLEGQPKRKGVYIRNGKKIAQSRRER